VADGKLVFLRPADGTGRLVFNDDAASAAPSVEISIDAQFDDDMDSGTVQLLWDANVIRDERAQLRMHWQQADPVAVRAATRWQPAQPIAARAQVRWQQAAEASGRAEIRWQVSQLLSGRTGVRWQDGAALRSAALARWQEAERLRAGLAVGWQDGAPLRLAMLARWQEAIRLRHAGAMAWQDAEARSARVVHRAGDAQPVRVGLALHWQDARRLPVGLSVVVAPQPPVVEPCYDPETLGRLVFSEPWVAGDGRLVFVCTRAAEPELPAGIVIPVRSWYVVQNSVTLHRVPSGAEFEASRFSLQLDADSWTFGWSASLHRSARQHLTRSTPGERVEVECAVNGVLYRLVVENIGRDRSFPEDRIQVRGRGRSAELSDTDLTFTNPANRTAQQLMADVLTVNGVSLGWALDWQIADWFVPADRWVFRGSYIGALQDIASAAGAYLQPHPTAKTLRVLPRYPHAPWDWETLLPVDIELPVDVTSVEGVEEVIRPDFNRVFVGGLQEPGYFGPVTRGGTAGDKVAAPILHPLITAAEAHIQRGRAELSNTGVQEHLSLRLMVLPETGIILPGKSIRYVDEDGPRLGIVRGTQVQMDRWPEMHQTLGVETHVE
jgi:hypothetical protein